MVERRVLVAIVGAQQSRVAKVVSLLTNDDTVLDTYESNDTIRVEYLPCVASFDSYENEQGQEVRYLAKVEYHGMDGRQRGSSLAPFFDDDKAEEDECGLPLFPGVSVVAIGCGIESQLDVAMIQTLVHSLAGETDEKETTRSFIVECVTPNSEYTNMKEENEAYRALSAEEKETVTRLRTMGPGKMARFAQSLAKSVVDLTLQDHERTNESSGPQTHGVSIDSSVEAFPSDEIISSTNEHDIAPQQPVEIDPSKTRYACRTCRTILFGQDQLENPPHVPMLHSFSGRSSFGTSIQCESLFLADGLHWMGDISIAVEGKFACPKCCTKIGHWKWAGAQCSCGTWVTPAIQVPFSKVDKVSPYSETKSPSVVKDLSQ